MSQHCIRASALQYLPGRLPSISCYLCPLWRTPTRGKLVRHTEAVTEAELLEITVSACNLVWRAPRLSGLSDLAPPGSGIQSKVLLSTCIRLTEMQATTVARPSSKLPAEACLLGTATFRERCYTKVTRALSDSTQTRDQHWYLLDRHGLWPSLAVLTVSTLIVECGTPAVFSVCLEDDLSKSWIFRRVG